MKHKTTTVKALPVRIVQFDSVQEALTILPEDVILRFINAAWHNTQIVKLADSMREVAATRKRGF